ncbi:inositol monophosphatase family protein [Planomonospora corallina]|uniref:Inositol monophosphatase family protein n=1 Tax=Planomonospora corallina TaxID=1806052 RepID=A0ABV8IH59_9ACTN
MTYELDLAVRTAVAAGRLITEYSAEGRALADYRGGFEPVTVADLASDGLIRDSLPGRVLSEGDVSPLPGPGGLSDLGDLDDLDGPLWIVDPIGGAADFSRGHRHVTVSIAYAVDGQVRAGVVHAPFLDETFTAVRGRGAFLNGRPIRAGEPEGLGRSVVGAVLPSRGPGREPLGLPPGGPGTEPAGPSGRSGAEPGAGLSPGASNARPVADPSPGGSGVEAVVERVRRLLTRCEGVRSSGAPSLDVCWTACGRLDACTGTLRPWEVAAAGLVATEAGARRGNLAPGPLPPDLDGEGLVVAAPAVYGELMTLLSD